MAQMVDGNAGQHAMRLSGQAFQDAGGVGHVGWLADDLAFEFQGGVSRQHRPHGQATFLDDFPAMHGLGAGNTLDVDDRVFVSQRRFVGLQVGTHAVAENHGVEIDADLMQEFAATGTT